MTHEQKAIHKALTAGEAIRKLAIGCPNGCNEGRAMLWHDESRTLVRCRCAGCGAVIVETMPDSVWSRHSAAGLKLSVDETKTRT